MKKVSEKGSTLFLRAAIIGVALVVLLLSSLLLPEIYKDWGRELPEIAGFKYPILLILSLSAAVFYYALLQGWKLLGYIDTNKAFSFASVRVLEKIKRCALLIAGLYAAGLPIIFQLAQIDDAPGLILIYSAIFVGAPVIVSVAVAVLQRLLQSAITIKSENDLTV